MTRPDTSANALHPSFGWKFLKLSRKLESEWLGTLDSQRPASKGLTKALIKHHVDAAQQHAFQQLVSALLLEEMWPEGHGGLTECGNGEKRILLGSGNLTLLIRQARAVYVGLFRSYESVSLVEGEDSLVLSLKHPAELIDILAAGMSPELHDNCVRLVSEVTNSFLNDALCRAYRELQNTSFENDATIPPRQSFWRWLLNGHGSSNIALFLEQWSSVGHPYHPIRKAKEGLTAAEVVALSPEFNASVAVRLAAIHRARMHIEVSVDCESLEKYMQGYFPGWLKQWREKLTRMGYEPGDYVPVPVHPWQAEHVLEPFRISQTTDVAIPFINGPEFPGKPTMSFRTVVPAGDTELPHIKLAMGLRLTSVPRTISPRSCHMGPRISDLLDKILADDAQLKNYIETVPEQIAIHYSEPGGQENQMASNLATIFRKNVSAGRTCGEIVIPAAALTVSCPGSGLPLFVEIFSESGDGTMQQMRHAFKGYLDTLLGGLLRMVLVYGIALEAHQQNALVVFGGNGELRRFLFRDFGGIRIHRQTLFSSGYALKLHANRLTVVDDWSAIRHKLMIATYHYHVGYMVAVLAQHFSVDDWTFWADVADVTSDVFTRLQTEVSPQLWTQEYDAMMNAPWIIKTSTRMRLLGSDRDTYAPFENPLKSALEYRRSSPGASS